MLLHLNFSFWLCRILMHQQILKMNLIVLAHRPGSHSYGEDPFTWISALLKPNLYTDILEIQIRLNWDVLWKVKSGMRPSTVQHKAYKIEGIMERPLFSFMSTALHLISTDFLCRGFTLNFAEPVWLCSRQPICLFNTKISWKLCFWKTVQSFVHK
jgi:hypothetical protein